ncbi:MAG: adenylate/guanylate cyclase domain-containing protein, partial [Solirubrobacterales bacterium]
TALALTIGIFKTVKDLRPVIVWLNLDRPPTPEEQALALLGPRRLLARMAMLWGFGLILFTALNFAYSPRLALVVGIAGLFSGLGTCAFSYLVAERTTREVARRALEEGPKEHPGVPGVTTRVMLTWAISTGVPILGVALMAGGVALDILPPDTQKFAYAAMAISGVALFIGLQAMFLVSRSIADPVKSVRNGIDRVGAGDLTANVPVYDASEIGLLQSGFNDMVDGLRERERVRDLFGRHVGEDVAEQALQVGAELGGEVREVAVVFIDIVGSTEMATKLPPQEVVELLNRFFGVVVDVVSFHGGSINKFEGDAALCIFGAPLDRADAAGDALAAARKMVKRLGVELPELAAGVGVSAGPAVAGNVGSAERHEYTVIGDPVNEAARLTEIAKTVEGGLVASARVVEAADAEESDRWRLGDEVVVRGRSEPTRLATPTG